MRSASSVGVSSSSGARRGARAGGRARRRQSGVGVIRARQDAGRSGRSACGPRRIRRTGRNFAGRTAALVRDLNENPAWHGILVQLPLPDHIDERVIIEAIGRRRTSMGCTR